MKKSRLHCTKVYTKLQWLLEIMKFHLPVTQWLDDPQAFCQKHIVWTLWIFSNWIKSKLAPIYSKRNVQHDSKAFFPLASRFTTILLRHVQKVWECDLRLYSRLFDFFCPSFLSFSFIFTAVMDLLLGLLTDRKILRKYHQYGQFLPWSSHVLL